MISNLPHLKNRRNLHTFRAKDLHVLLANCFGGLHRQIQIDCKLRRRTTFLAARVVGLSGVVMLTPFAEHLHKVLHVLNLVCARCILVGHS